ncbi:GNAT family N-acetyltransferase [Cognatishimia maritima]|uniref:Ribosomal protein S18 acetylase RimI n=1 Tax=Cognatishimia maritima TaxID=870908 RepID=A0A1M5KWZ0_9RHOB|nr:GNAT family N-acetyltransferase [Cognatishimia maritima]SHG57256.1 Ribosomal protein S18 acetylase RimI [Cognatishimia maritima]
MILQIRPAVASDVDETRDILTASQGHQPWLSRLRFWQSTRSYCDMMVRRGWVKVAVNSGHILGFLARDQQYIHALYVARDNRGQHIGHHLLRDAQMQEVALELCTAQSNAGAQRFYLREGFREIARSSGWQNDRQEPDIRYRWERGAL